MIKIIELCPVCGGKGKFLSQRCPSCNGKGGKSLKCDAGFVSLFEQHKERLGEQEVKVFELFKAGYSQKDISKNLDLTISQVAVILHNIEKKLNS